jgi:acetyl-CoA C-acetyltransferase
MEAYIIAGSRTPFGSYMGALSTMPATQLGACALKGALHHAGLSPQDVQEVIMGQVIQAGAGQAPARQAALGAGLPDSVPSTTINKVCGSGMQAIIMGARLVQSGEQQVVMCGGMENMSLAPHLIPQSRQGMKFGPQEIKDSMQWDGLWDVYSNRAMGNCAEECVQKYSFTREQQDQFAIESFKRAQLAQKEGKFQAELTPVVMTIKGKELAIKEDEGPGKALFEKIPGLKPAFEKNGTITAANASTINDGAAAVIVSSKPQSSKNVFRIVSWASHAQHPTWFTTAPKTAIEKALNKSKLSVKDIGAWEINEAFAAVTMACEIELKLDHALVNHWGGAVALGHPIGASGARIVMTLMNVMRSQKTKYGCAAICIGGGEALAMILEQV